MMGELNTIQRCVQRHLRKTPGDLKLDLKQA